LGSHVTHAVYPIIRFGDHDVEDAGEQDEFLELAEICIEIAIRVEERATGG
jgi:hypothetical protein